MLFANPYWRHRGRDNQVDGRVSQKLASNHRAGSVRDWNRPLNGIRCGQNDRTDTFHFKGSSIKRSKLGWW